MRSVINSVLDSENILKIDQYLVKIWRRVWDFGAYFLAHSVDRWSKSYDIFTYLLRCFATTTTSTAVWWVKTTECENGKKRCSWSRQPNILFVHWTLIILQFTVGCVHGRYGGSGHDPHKTATVHWNVRYNTTNLDVRLITARGLITRKSYDYHTMW